MRMIDKGLLDLLACPACKTPITYEVARDVLKCGQCQRIYPIRNGIPILLVDEAKVDGG